MNSVGVYAKVSSRIDWISDVIEGRAQPVTISDTSTFYPTTYTKTDYHIETLYTTYPSTVSSVSDTTLPNFRCSGNRWFNSSESFSRIVNGITAGDGNWPWIVNLSIGKQTQYNLRTMQSSTAHCVGSLLTDRFVLTAGKCCDGSETSEMNIYAGSNNFYDGDLYE